MDFSHLRIVLVRPQYSGNIGAIARAMLNFGVRDLALVNPAIVNRAQADIMAVHARSVLDTMQIHNSLSAAIADCGLVVGTTCRTGLYRDDISSPRQLAPAIVTAMTANRVAIIFGPEDSGLSNADLRCCQRLVTIPTDSGYPSLNIAQAVLVCCYEVFLATQDRVDCEEIPARSLAVAEKQELMYEKLKDALLRVGFLHEDNPEHIMFAFRRILGRAGLEDRDVRILLGMARQIGWYAESGWRLRQQSSECKT
ncbi:MAG: RNA methyltransferase [Candidatus Binatia bacterium]